MTLPVGSSAPLHVHDDLDDTWYVLEGEMVVRCGDEVSVAGAGHWLSMPRGVPHTFRVVGDRPARILLVHDNATFRDLIRDVGVPAQTRVLPDQPIFPSPDELARVAAGHDLSPDRTTDERRRRRRRPRRRRLRSQSAPNVGDRASGPMRARL